MTRVLSDGEAVDVVLSEREYQKVFAPPIHSKADLLLLMEHYLLRARTDLLCPQMEAGAEGSSIRKVGALALRFISEHGAPMRVRKPGEARSPKLPNDPPASSDTKSMAALRGLLELYDRETCTHDDVKRGGSIWTICNQCDRKWADDRDGGFKPYTDPPPVMLARDLVYGAQRAKADEACDALRDAWSDFEDAMLTDGNDGWVPAPVVRACKEAFVLAWSQGPEAAVRAALATYGKSGIPAERVGAMEAERIDPGHAEATALRQARYVLRDLHAKHGDCGYGKLAEVCDRAADRVAASEEDELRRALADVVTQIRAGRVNIVCAGGIHTQGAGGSKSLGRVDDHEVWQRAIRLSGLDA